MNDNRHPAGTSVGGQWAPGASGEVDDQLDFEDAFDDIGHTEHEGRIDLDDWGVREQMRDVRTEDEKFGVAGFVHPSKRSQVQMLSYQLDDAEAIERTRDQVAPASSVEEVAFAARQYGNWEAEKSYMPDDEINNLILRDQSRRGLSATPPTRLAPPTDYGPGGGYASRWDGANYESGMTTKDVAKNVRGDIAESVKSGWLPQDFTYSVRKRDASAITVVAESKTHDQDAIRPPENDNIYGRQMDPEASEVQRRLSAITDSYRRHQTDTMTDLYNVSFYCSPTVVGKQRHSQ